MKTIRKTIRVVVGLAVVSLVILRGDCANNPCTETSRTTNCLQNATVSLSPITWDPAAPAGAPYNSIQCVGNNITASTTKTVTPAKHQVTIHYSNCPDSVQPAVNINPTTTDTYTVSGVKSLSGSGLSVTFTSLACGTGSVEFKSTASLSGTPCGINPPNPAIVSGTYAFVEVVSLSPDLPPDQGGLESGSVPPTYWVCPCGGDVIVTAYSCPSLTADKLPACWTFTGGVEINKLQHKVSKAALRNGPVTFTVTAGTSTKTIILKQDDEKLIYNSYFPDQQCLYDNFYDPSPYYDKCGNSLSINCVGATGFPFYHAGHYEYRYNSTWVGTCYFNDGQNNFLYKATKHDCLILRTWHLTQEPLSPTRWVVTKYNCLTGGAPSQNCRTAPSWDPNWGRPADEPNPGYPANSCENKGTPSTPCPP